MNFVEYFTIKKWLFEDSHQEVRPVHFDDQNGDYSIMTAQLFFQRRVLFYNFNFVIPSVLITILIVAGFALPCESGKKIGLRNFKRDLCPTGFNLYRRIIFSHVITMKGQVLRISRMSLVFNKNTEYKYIPSINFILSRLGITDLVNKVKIYTNLIK